MYSLKKLQLSGKRKGSAKTLENERYLINNIPKKQITAYKNTKPSSDPAN